MARARTPWAPQPWMRQAACAAHDDPDLWFPDPSSEQRQRQALRVCAACPVRAACLAYALSMPPQPGIWGGTTEGQRRQAGRSRAQRAAGRRRPEAGQHRRDEERERRRRLRAASAAGGPPPGAAGGRERGNPA
jgi:WhiB family redox-sensing transcriptional regulator